MTFEEARAAFPVLARVAYLNAGSTGPLARATVEAMTAAAQRDLEHGRGGKAYYDEMMRLREEVRTRLAALLGVDAANVALTSSTTDGCNIVVSGLGLRPGDEVVTTDGEHPGLLAPLHMSGARIVVAPAAKRPAAEALETILAAITPRTRLLALSHVLWLTGQVMPLDELKAATGLPILGDGAQSVGAMPVDVGELDFYTVSGQKWLCGPETTGALYVRDPERLRVALPTYLSQQAIERDGAFVPTDGAARFDFGWIAPAALAGLEAAIDGAPADRFELASRAAARCREALAAAGYDVVTEAGQATLVTWVARGEPAADAARLYERGVIVRDLPGTPWLRASCGWWTTDEHVERLVAGLA